MLNKDTISKLLLTNDKAVARALVVLNNNQTATEQNSQATINRNGMGFRPCHARMGTSMATFYQARGFLTAKQIAYWRMKDKAGNMRIEIYWKQLVDAANKKVAVVKSVTVAKPTNDVGNMQEELMVLEEQYLDYQDSDDFSTLEKMAEQIAFLRKEISRAYAEAQAA